MRKEVPSYQKPLWQQFSFFCIVSLLGIVLLKKTVSLSVLSFLILTGVSYFLLGLLIGDLGWGFLSAHSKTLFLKTNWLLRLPFNAVSRIASRGSSGQSSPVPFAEMVGEVPEEVETAPGRPSIAPHQPPAQLSSKPTTPAQPSHAQPFQRPVPSFSYSSRTGHPSSALSLLAQAEDDKRHPSLRHPPSAGEEQEEQEQNVPLLATFDKPYFQHQQPSPRSSRVPATLPQRLTPRGNGSEVAAVLSQATTEFQPRRMQPVRHHDSMIAALVDAHGMGRN